jgi:tetratricopeptide (TPR) repeat protein
MTSHERFTLALEREKTGDIAGALNEYALLVKDEPYRPALVNLGSLYSRMDHLDEALDCFTRALELQDDHIAWFNVGSVRYKRGEFKQAVIALERSRRINPSFNIAVLVMGLSFRKLGNTASAERCFVESLDAEPDNEVALTALALIAYDTGFYSSAIDYLDKLVKLRPGSAGAKKLRAKSKLMLGRVDGADDLKSAKEDDEGFVRFEKFVQTVPTKMFADNLGSLPEKIEMLEERVAEQKKPDDLIALSLCCLFNGDSNRAIDYLFMAKS